MYTQVYTRNMHAHYGNFSCDDNGRDVCVWSSASSLVLDDIKYLPTTWAIFFYLMVFLVCFNEAVKETSHRYLLVYNWCLCCSTSGLPIYMSLHPVQIKSRRGCVRMFKKGSWEALRLKQVDPGTYLILPTCILYSICLVFISFSVLVWWVTSFVLDAFYLNQSWT